MIRRRRLLTAVLIPVTVLALTGGAVTDTTAAPIGDDALLEVYAITGYLADAVTRIAPEAEVTTMVGPAEGSNTDQPSPRGNGGTAWC